MAKTVKVKRVPVVAGTLLFYGGVYHNPGAVVYMTRDEADEQIAMRFVREPKPGELDSAESSS